MKNPTIRRLTTKIAFILSAGLSLGLAHAKIVTAIVQSQTVCGEESICVKSDQGEYRANFFALSKPEKKLLELAAKRKEPICLKDVSSNSGSNYFEHVAAACVADNQNAKMNPTVAAQNSGNKSSYAAKINEVCRMAYDYYYVSFKKSSQSRDPAVMQIQCLSGAQSIANEEVIAFDMQTLLEQAKVEPDNYREAMANAMQFACVRNSTGTKGITYAEFSRTQCGNLAPGHTKK